MKKEKAYKVVRKVYEEYYSVFAVGDLRTEYKVGRTTKPRFKLLPLYAFETLKEAKVFVEESMIGLGKPCVFECEITRSRSKYAFGWLPLTIYGCSFSWTEAKGVLRCGAGYSFPKGTIPCASITLLREIEK
jgi:hypothetical protein